MMDLSELHIVRRLTKADRAGRDQTTLVARIATVLRARQRAMDLSATDFAAHLGIGRQRLYAIYECERGLRLSTIETLADALNMNIYELMGVPPALVQGTPELASVRKAVPGPRPAGGISGIDEEGASRPHL